MNLKRFGSGPRIDEFKKCRRCNRQYFSCDDFRRKTAFVGFQRGLTNSHFELELRNCRCGNTLAHRTLALHKTSQTA